MLYWSSSLNHIEKSKEKCHAKTITNNAKKGFKEFKCYSEMIQLWDQQWETNSASNICLPSFT